MIYILNSMKKGANLARLTGLGLNPGHGKHTHTHTHTHIYIYNGHTQV